MRLPIFDKRRSEKRSEKLRGGGGHGGGHGGGRGGGRGSSPSPPPAAPRSGGGGGGTSPKPGGSGRPPTSVSTPNLPPGSKGSSSYGIGGGRPITISSGTFAGRTSGGGTRSQMFGSRIYGSGYPGLGSRSVAGRNFPFGYWPLVWGAGVGGGIAYLRNDEYGRPDNSSRPGGALFQVPLMELNDNTTYHLVADNSTISAVLSALESNCSLSTNPSSMAFNPQDSTQPQPGQVIQYCRSSSIALTLNGYNNSATYSNDSNAIDTPLPTNLNMTFLDCLNQTIAASAPIQDNPDTSADVGGASPLAPVPIFGTAWLLVVLLHMML